MTSSDLTLLFHLNGWPVYGPANAQKRHHAKVMALTPARSEVDKALARLQKPITLEFSEVVELV